MAAKAERAEQPGRDVRVRFEFGIVRDLLHFFCAVRHTRPKPRVAVEAGRWEVSGGIVQGDRLWREQVSWEGLRERRVWRFVYRTINYAPCQLPTVRGTGRLNRRGYGFRRRVWQHRSCDEAEGPAYARCTWPVESRREKASWEMYQDTMK